MLQFDAYGTLVAASPGSIARKAVRQKDPLITKNMLLRTQLRAVSSSR